MNAKQRRMTAYNARKAEAANRAANADAVAAARAAHYGFTGFRGSTVEDRRRYLRSISR